MIFLCPNHDYYFFSQDVTAPLTINSLVSQQLFDFRSTMFLLYSLV